MTDNTTAEDPKKAHGDMKPSMRFVPTLPLFEVARVFEGGAGVSARADAPKVKGLKVASCHPNRKHQARGMCKPCYDKWLKSCNPDYKKRQAENATKWMRFCQTYSPTFGDK